MLDPALAPTYNNRRFAYGELGDLDRSIVDYDQAIALDLQYAGTYLLRGLAQSEVGTPTEAIADLKRALDLGLDPYFKQQAAEALKKLEK